MPKFLFWNLNRRDLHGFVSNLARQENADVVILAECPKPGAPGSPFCWANLGSVHSAPGKSRFGSCQLESSSAQVIVQKTDANLGHQASLRSG
jgi:hypothetical protein